MRSVSPTAVLLEMNDGEMELMFASYEQAEIFVYLLPLLMMAGQWNDVASAIISPLVKE